MPTPKRKKHNPVKEIGVFRLLPCMWTGRQGRSSYPVPRAFLRQEIGGRVTRSGASHSRGHRILKSRDPYSTPCIPPGSPSYHLAHPPPSFSFLPAAEASAVESSWKRKVTSFLPVGGSSVLVGPDEPSSPDTIVIPPPPPPLLIASSSGTASKVRRRNELLLMLVVLPPPCKPC